MLALYMIHYDTAILRLVTKQDYPAVKLVGGEKYDTGHKVAYTWHKYNIHQIDETPSMNLPARYYTCQICLRFWMLWFQFDRIWNSSLRTFDPTRFSWTSWYDDTLWQQRKAVSINLWRLVQCKIKALLKNDAVIRFKCSSFLLWDHPTFSSYNRWILAQLWSHKAAAGNIGRG